MRILVLTFICAMAVLFGCASMLTPYESCMGGCENQEQESVRKSCRATCRHVVQERTVNVEYAGDCPYRTAPKLELQLKGKDQYECTHEHRFVYAGNHELLYGIGRGITKMEAKLQAQAAWKSQITLYRAEFGLSTNLEDLKNSNDPIGKTTQYVEYCTDLSRSPGHNRYTLPKATWPRRATIKDMATGKPLAVPSALAWDPSIQVFMAQAYKYESAKKQFVPTERGQSELFDCRAQAHPRIWIGPDLGSVVVIEVSQRRIIGPKSHAQSQITAAAIDAARDYADGQKWHLAGDPSDCWKSGTKQPLNSPLGWSGIW